MEHSRQQELAQVQQLHRLPAASLLLPKVKSPEQCEMAAMQLAVQRGLRLAEEAKVRASDVRQAPQGGAVTIATVGSKVVYSMQMACTEQNKVFCARDDDTRLVVFVDDGREVTLVAASAVSKEWEESQGESIHITGIGESKKGTYAAKMVTVPLRLRGAMEETWITGYVVSDAVMPDGIDVLVGKPAIKEMGVKPDLRNMRMEFAEVLTESGIPLILNTMPIEKQLDIRSALPLRVLDICGGGSFSYQPLRDMGPLQH